MVNKVRECNGKEIILNIKTPQHIAELKEQLNSIDNINNRFVMNQNNKNKECKLFSKIKKVIKDFLK
jgi:ferritin-like metal-binding protein YciE